LLVIARTRKSNVAGSRMFLVFEKPKNRVTMPKTDNNIMGYIF
jgi:hypothetical protein